MKKLFGCLFALSIIGCDNNKQSAEKDLTIKDELKNNQILSVEKATLNDSIDKKKEVPFYKILPVDESKKDSTLVNFISKLKTLVKNKDKASLLKVLDKEIVVSEGGGIYGIEAFSNEWNLQNPEKSSIWKNLENTLQMGGTWEEPEDGKYFSIPYTQSNKILNKFNYEFDWYNTAVVRDVDVKIFKEPKLDSKIINTLSYDIVEIDPDFSHSEFSKIETIDRKMSGYVKSNSLIHSASRTLIIQKRGNHWKITSFAPFD